MVAPSVRRFPVSMPRNDHSAASDAPTPFALPDRRGIERLRQRFLDLNAGRLERVHQLLSTRQQRVLHLLPLLFHVNHPGLPGYVSTATPAGLDAYEPTAAALNEARQLARSFRYWALPQGQAAPIRGLFLMGSLGTLAHTEQSDMDLWLCHDPALDEEALALLRRKARAVEAWAAGQGAELHVFLVDPERFASGRREAELSGEDCGSSQHYLLLDEFFRTALWLGGRTPTWWLVPTEQEARYPEYVATLRARGLLPPERDLDLGYLGRVPAQEYLGAGMWQLYKAMQSPYKSALKLLLNEAYASAHPEGECLALAFKRDVLAGASDLDALDPYIRLYQRLESHLLGRDDPARLELVRRCLYLKIDRPLSRPVSAQGRTWQRQLLQQLCASWGWGESQVTLLDSRPRWKLRQVEGELRLLVAALVRSYVSLKQFAEQRQVLSPLSERDMRVLGRRLNVLFARGVAKIDSVNPGIAPNLAEPNLTLRQLDAEHWALYDGSLTRAQCQDRLPLRRARHLIGLLTWAQRNGILDSATRVTLHPGRSSLRDFELQGLRAGLQTLPPPQAEVADALLLRPRRADRELLLINVGLDPLQGLSRGQLAGGRNDVLDYAGGQVNLVRSLDRVTLTTWNEVLHRRYEGPQAFSECLRHLLADGVPPERVQFQCFTQNRARALAQRLEGLYAEASAALAGGGRLLLQVAGGYRIWRRDGQRVEEQLLADLPALQAYLGAPQPGPLRLDSQALGEQVLGLVLRQAEAGCLQLFYQNGEETRIHLLDEHNRLWRQTLPERAETALARLQHFFEASLRGAAHRPEDAVRYYQLLPGAPATATEMVRRLPPRAEPGAPPLRAHVHRDARGREWITLCAGRTAFAERTLGGGLYAAVVGWWRAQGEAGAPLVAEMALSGAFDAKNTLDYLERKQRIELALRQAAWSVADEGRVRA